MKPRMASAPSKPAPRMPVNTVVAEPLQTSLSAEVIDATPATRTLVPAQEASSSIEVVVDRSPPLEATRTGSAALVVPRDRTPLWAAGGVVAVLAATAGVVMVMRGGPPAEPLSTLQPTPIADAATLDALPAPSEPAPVAALVPAPTEPTEPAGPVAPAGEPSPPHPVQAEETAPVRPMLESATPEPAPKPDAAKGARKSADKTPANSADDNDKPKPKVEKRAPPVRKGNVYVEVQGGWAEVWIGGKAIGETPLQVPLPAGRQSILLKKPSGAQKRVDVVIVPGETIRVKETL
jgi:hypothetical protein